MYITQYFPASKHNNNNTFANIYFNIEIYLKTNVGTMK